MSQKNPWKRSQSPEEEEEILEVEEIKDEEPAAEPVEVDSEAEADVVDESEPVSDGTGTLEEARRRAREQNARKKSQEERVKKMGPFEREKEAMKAAAKKKMNEQQTEGSSVDDFWGIDWDEVPPPKASDVLDFRFPKKLQGRSKGWIAVFCIIMIALIYVLYWWFHPALNIHSQNLWIFVGVVVLLPAFILLRGWGNTLANGSSKHEPNPKKANLFKKLALIPVGIACLGLIGALLSMSWFPGNASKYASVLPIEEMDFTEDIQEVDYTQIPIIDRASAQLLGNRAMGTIADYVSQFEIDSLYSQINYQDTPVRVSPLNYANIIKWITNYKTGIPAYSIVNMTTQEAEVVRLAEPMYYTPSDPLFRNIDRYVQLKYPTYMFDEKAFEIDDDGNPWWVCPVQERTIGLFGGTTIQKVVLCNACTGDCEVYDIDDCPTWVDRAYPSELLVEQYNWYGKYINGWWNSWLGQNGVRQTTPGTDDQLGYNYIAKDDDVWLYSGVTSATADDSIIGFVLINQRTGEAHYYSISGATEDSAMASAEGQVQNLEYSSTFPLLLNISGQPTYFMALKDNAGLVKKFAMIDIQRYQNVAVGDTVAETQKSYKALLATNGVVTSSSVASGDQSAVSGTIDTFTPVVIDGDTHFYFTIEGSSTLYDCPVTITDIVTYSAGDSIEFNCYEGTGLVQVTEIL